MDIDPLPASTPLLALIQLHAGISTMGSGEIAALLIACLALVLSGFISGSEIAFFSLSHDNLDSLSETPHGVTVRKLLSMPERLLATILIGNNFVNVLIVILTNFALGPVFQGMNEVWSFVLQTVILTFVILLFGEILPKLYARNNAQSWARHSAGSIYFMMKLFYPLSSMLVRSQSIVGKVVTKKGELISTDDLSNALQVTDVKSDANKEMLEGILKFGDKTASEIMTPRVDITDIDVSSDFAEVMRIVNESGYARIPVYEQTQDNILGVLYSRDLLPHIHQPASFDWRKLLREPYYVPESRMIDNLLEDFRRRKIHMAIVVDEFGGTQGLVTLEDVLEEIVGDINDEYDDDEKTYKQLADNTFVFEGKTLLSDFFRVTGLDEDDYKKVAEDVETLAGMLLAIKGDFPKEKEPIVYHRCHFLVLEIDGHRIAEVRVKVMPE